MDTLTRAAVALVASTALALIIGTSFERFLLNTVLTFVIIELLYRALGWKMPRG